MWRYYSPLRLWRVFALLLTLFLLIKRRDRFFLFRPLTPQKLIETITKLGTSFVKLAQVLATRSDFFPPDYLNALKTLHDELPPMTNDAMQRVFQKAFVQNPFLDFENEAIASASIGQVHKATLQDGSVVAVKLRREGVEMRVRADIHILVLFNALFRPLFSHYTKHSVEAVIAEFSDMILKEVSLDQERSNLEKFSIQYADQPIRFPKAYAKYSSDDALVMSYEEGFRFDDKAAIEAHSIKIEPLIEILVNFYTEQMLVQGFFHADPHPGNLLIAPDGKLVLLDFGMLKRIPNETRIAIIELIKNAHDRNFEGYVRACKKLGIVVYEAPANEVAEFAEQMFEIFENDSLNSTTMQDLAFDLLGKTRNLPFKLPQEAIYILRASAIIEGLGTTYIENFNGIKDILPILQKNIPRALGLQDGILGTLIKELKMVPTDLMAFRSLIRRANEGELAVELSKAQLASLQKSLHDSLLPLITGFILLFGALFALFLDRENTLIATLLFAIGTARLLFR